MAGDCSPEVPKALHSHAAHQGPGRTSSTWRISTKHPQSLIDQLIVLQAAPLTPRGGNHSLPSLQLQIFKFPVCCHACFSFPANKEHQYSVFLYTSACSHQADLAPLSSHIPLSQKKHHNRTQQPSEASHMLCVYGSPQITKTDHSKQTAHV